MKSLVSLFAVLVFAATSFAQLQPHSRNYTVYGIVQPEVFPLENGYGQIIQWNAPTFEGFIKAGKSSKNYCKDAYYCYSYDGQGNWQFNMTGDVFCPSPTYCTYTATGELEVSEPIQLPDGSTTWQLTAALNGTFTDQYGNVSEGVMGYYSTFTAPSLYVDKAFLPVPAQGGITIVLQDN